jgi:TPP-dependent pyruvate/acetoin dehydrogenase alpha subunit
LRLPYEQGSPARLDSPLIAIYRSATLIHRADAKLRSMIASGELQIVYYSPRGQEIVAAGLMAAVESRDYLVTTYRGLHDQLAKGIPARDLFAEFAGKATGTCKGKGGPMHITHPLTGVMVTTGIVGSGLPIANGLALASQLEADGRVTVCCFGDAATNIGAFHEALNLAQLWRLPVVFVCQNNLYGEHTAISLSTCVTELVERARGYGMASVQVDGNNALEMYGAARRAVNRARDGSGPTFIEAKTFRFSGHLIGDDSHYIPAAQMAAARAADPVPAYRSELLRLGIPAGLLDSIDAEVGEIVDEAAQYALNSAYPDASQIRADVFACEVL